MVFRKLALVTIAASLSTALVPMPLAAQSSSAEARLERLEQQVRALQRTVFPGGDNRFFEPEIAPSTGQPQNPPPGSPSTSAMTDVLARLQAIEAQLARLTASTEVNQNALNGIEARVVTLEERAGTQPSGVIPVPASPTQSSGGSTPAPSSSASTGELPAATRPAAPTPERVAGVQAIAKPVTDDPGDDEYSYGFRLWEAGYYPEAQQQLALFLEKYPRHSRVTYGRNLLGRAYLDAGDARRAATFFFENYQADKQAARAPDSLLYLSEAMIALGDTNRACIALAEFGDTYPALATGRLKTQYDSNRARVDCAR